MAGSIFTGMVAHAKTELWLTLAGQVAQMTPDYSFRKLFCEAKVLYGLMLDRMGHSIKNKWLDEKERVYIFFTVEETMEMLGCSRQKAIRSLAELDTEKGIGLIEKKMLALLLQSFRALAKKTIPFPLIRRIFEMRAMIINGEFPYVNTLGAEGDTLYTLQFIAGTPIQKLYTFKVSDEVYALLSQIIDVHMKKVIDRKFHSLEILCSL